MRTIKFRNEVLVMILNPNPNYPLTHSFVLKLHRDAVQRGEIVGRLENMASGHCCEFVRGEKLRACLTNDCTPPAGPQWTDDATGPSTGSELTGVESPSTSSGRTDGSTISSAVTDPSPAPDTSPSDRVSVFPLHRFFIQGQDQTSRVISFLLIAALALTGCAGTPVQTPNAFAQTNAKPKLAALLGSGLDMQAGR
jgi:hypothetical protein